MASLNSKDADVEKTLGMLGCGTMGQAILSGIISDPTYRAFVPLGSDLAPVHFPSRFIVSVRRADNVNRVAEELMKIDISLSHEKDRLRVLHNGNLQACQDADVVLLCCQPYMVKEILSAEGIAKALSGKLLISICAGVPISEIEMALYGGKKAKDVEACRVVRAIPNLASAIRESVTIIETTVPPLPKLMLAMVIWIFERVGRVVHFPPMMMDASAAICGSGPAFFALVMEAMVDGAVAMGLPREEARKITAQTMKGTADLVLRGEHPASIRDKSSTPGGCTFGGLLVLEKGMVRDMVARAVREATLAAGQVGKGIQGGF